MTNWRFVQGVALGSLYVCFFALIASLGTGWRGPHYYGLPLVALLYGLHWRWQGLAYRLDYPRSEQLVAIVKFRRSSTNPEL